MDIASVVTAAAWLGAALLVVAGAAKLRVPDGAMATLHRLRLPSGRTAARALGAAEIGLGASVIGVGGAAGAAILAAGYGGLAVVAAWQRRAQVACGCFGTSHTAVTRLHVGLNVAFALSGVAALRTGLTDALTVARDAGPLGVVAAALLVAAGTGLLRAALETRAGAIGA